MFLSFQHSRKKYGFILLISLPNLNIISCFILIMGILKRCEIIEIISEIRNINKEDVVLYNENEYNFFELLNREKTSVFIQHWWKNKLDEKYMEGFQENTFPQDLTEWFCRGCGENGLNCECFS